VNGLASSARQLLTWLHSLINNSFLVGLVTGIATGVLGNAAYDLLKKRVRGAEQAYDRKTAKRGELKLKLVPVGKGAHEFIYHFAPGKGLTEDQLRCRFVRALPLSQLLALPSNHVAFPGGAKAIAKEIQAERRRLAKSAAQGPVIEWNGRQLALRHLQRSATPDAGGVLERDYFNLDFAETDYASTKVVARLWASSPVDVTTIPNNRLGEVMPGWSHSFGVNATVETSDNQLLLTRRGSATRTFSGYLHISMNEGMRPDDTVRVGDQDPIPSIPKVFERGFLKELSLAPELIHRSELVIHTLLLDLYHYEWAALGHLNLAAKVDEIKVGAVAAEDWEHDKLFTIGMTRQELEHSLFENGPWVPHGALNVVLSAMAKGVVDNSWLMRLAECRTS
jgi:hypothetical protein